jgi:small subunit ribosomal protein S13
LARIAGVNLPNKPISIALTYVFGIGRTSAVQICERASVAGDMRANDLADDELVRIREIIDRDYQIEGDLRR